MTQVSYHFTPEYVAVLNEQDAQSIQEANFRGFKRGVINGPLKSSHYAVRKSWRVGDPIGSGATEAEAIRSLIAILDK